MPARLLVIAGAVLGLVGLLALPQQEVRRVSGDVRLDYGDLHGDADAFSGLSGAWWSYGLVLAGVVVAIGAAALAATASRAIGLVLAVLAAAVGALHAVVLDRTDLSDVLAPINPDPGYAYDRFGSGAWCLLGGLAVVAVGGVLATAGRRRTPLSAEGRT